MPLYGRHRLSIADIESDLHDLIANHPRSHLNDDGEPVVPAEALVDIFTSYRSAHNNVELLSKEEEEMFLHFIQTSPGLEATTKVLVEFIAFRTASGDKAPESALSSDEGSESDSPDRGRRSRGGVYKATSRSSSSDSIGTSVYRPPSRPSSNGPPVPPKTPSLRDSVFDTSKRQRSTPLVNNAPSSWAKRPAPASRRKSDAGRGGSDSESGPNTPSWDRRRSSQTRTSTPPSPTTSHQPLSSPPLGSRPHSRSQSYPQNMAALYNSDRFDDDNDLTISQPVSADNSLDEMSFLSSISSLPIPKHDDDTDSDDEVQSILVYDRSAAQSNASMDSQERVDVLNKTIDELRKKLSDTEKGLNRKVNDLELELEEAQEKLEELKAELIAARKEEKELKSKEKQNQNQISALEAEISKLHKGLENSRASYQSLQKLYQEQCAESERCRLSLRRRDTEVKEFVDAAALHAVETEKWNKEQQVLEDRVNQLTADLELAQQAYSSLDDQKAENLLLKETIDRLRFEMDEMRTNAANALDQSKDGVAGSAASVGRTLGAEMVRAGVDPNAAPPKRVQQEEDSEDETIVDEMINQESDDDEFIQTVITKTRKRKIHGRMPIPTLTAEREYADAEVQHELSTLDVEIQTLPEPKPVLTSLFIQTEGTPISSVSIQTDPLLSPPQKILVEMQAQTEEIDTDEASSSGHHEGEESMASSSSTLLPPTPKPSVEQLHPHDLPPAYDRSELDFRIAEAVKDLHPGSTRPNELLTRVGVSEDALEEWKALKAELGIECLVIDNVLQGFPRSGRRRPSTSSAPSSASSSSSSRKGRFYNIYNTYIYSGETGGPGLTNVILCAGVSAVAFVVMAHLGNPQYHIPGGPTYYDRAAWTSFNTMQVSGEGFAADGTNAFWDLIGRLGGNAARIVQGWPT